MSNGLKLDRGLQDGGRRVMTAERRDEELVVRDELGQVHRRNPLGGHACLGCALPFPCPTAVGGEQLAMEVGRG